MFTTDSPLTYIPRANVSVCVHTQAVAAKVRRRSNKQVHPQSEGNQL